MATNPFNQTFSGDMNFGAGVNPFQAAQQSAGVDGGGGGLSPWGDLSSSAMQANPLNPAQNAAQGAQSAAGQMMGATDALDGMFSGQSPFMQSYMGQQDTSWTQGMAKNPSQIPLGQLMETYSPEKYGGGRLGAMKASQAFEKQYEGYDYPKSLGETIRNPENFQQQQSMEESGASSKAEWERIYGPNGTMTRARSGGGGGGGGGGKPSQIPQTGPGSISDMLYGGGIPDIIGTKTQLSATEKAAGRPVNPYSYIYSKELQKLEAEQDLKKHEEALKQRYLETLGVAKKEPWQ